MRTRYVFLVPDSASKLSSMVTVDEALKTAGVAYAGVTMSGSNVIPRLLNVYAEEELTEADYAKVCAAVDEALKSQGLS